MKNIVWLFGVVITVFALNMVSCKHDAILDTNINTNPQDTTTNPQDTTTNPQDTTTYEPCDTTIVYFEQQILPLLVSNCAYSGCHDAASHEDGVILDSYATVMQTGEVKPFNPGQSELYKVLIDNDPEDRMPPAPNNPLTTEQIDLIALWISQGAENTSCDPDATNCDTTDVSFSATIAPIMSTYCQGCHSGTAPSGGIDLSTYNNVKVYANNGKLLGSVKWDPGYSAMPEGSQKLSDCKIDQIASWIAAGAPNN